MDQDNESEDSHDSDRTLVLQPPRVTRRLDCQVNLTAEAVTTRVPLVRILVGKVQNEQDLDTIIQQQVIQQEPENSTTQRPSVQWVQDILEALQKDKNATHGRGRGSVMGTSCLDWETVRAETMRYLSIKYPNHAEERQNGRLVQNRPLGKISNI